jgi:hypothetical protein
VPKLVLGHVVKGFTVAFLEIKRDDVMKSNSHYLYQRGP